MHTYTAHASTARAVLPVSRLCDNMRLLTVLSEATASGGLAAHPMQHGAQPSALQDASDRAYNLALYNRYHKLYYRLGVCCTAVCSCKGVNLQRRRSVCVLCCAAVYSGSGDPLASVHKLKHMRVQPQFNAWSCFAGCMTLHDGVYQFLCA